MAALTRGNVTSITALPDRKNKQNVKGRRAMAALTRGNITSITVLPGCGRGPRIANQTTILRRCCYFKRSLPGVQPVGLCNLLKSAVISNKHEGRFPNSKNSHIIYATPTSHVSINESAAVETDSANTQVLIEVLKDTWDAFYRFSRPHTVIGTVIAITSVSLLVVQSVSDLSPLFFVELLKALIPAVLMNIYIVGFNQLFDVEIDKINKPYLPIASGEYSIEAGGAIAVASAFMSLTMAWMIGSKALLGALWMGFALGTAYSVDLPFLRWKRSALAAATSILSVRTIAVQLAFYHHMQNFVYKRPAVLTKPLIFGLAFTFCFSLVIALFKDIPDVEGDKFFGIQSFSVRLGQKRVFWLCIYLLQAVYCAAMILGAASPYKWSKFVMISAHGLLSAILWRRSHSIDLGSKAAIVSFYMFVWKLFYAEYLLLPFIR